MFCVRQTEFDVRPFLVRVWRVTGDRLKDWCRLNRAASQLDARMEVIGFRPEQFRDEHPLVWEVKTHGIKLCKTIH